MLELAASHHEHTRRIIIKLGLLLQTEMCPLRGQSTTHASAGDISIGGKYCMDGVPFQELGI